MQLSIIKDFFITHHVFMVKLKQKQYKRGDCSTNSDSFMYYVIYEGESFLPAEFWLDLKKKKYVPAGKRKRSTDNNSVSNNTINAQVMFAYIGNSLREVLF